MRKFLAGALACAIAFSLVMPGVPVAAAEQTKSKSKEIESIELMEGSEGFDESREEAYVSGDFIYSVNADNTATLEEYTGSATSLLIPSQIAGHTVTTLGSDFLYGNYGVENVVVPDTVTTIADWAFCHSEIESVTLGNNVNYIGYCAFYNCDYLTSITIPASITKIEECGIGGCMQLGNITVAAGNPSYRVIGNALYNMDGTTLLTYFSANTSTVYDVPNGVIRIGESAFEGASYLKKITLPATVSSIGGYAFTGCYSLERMVIPDGVEEIPEEAFDYCYNLISITIPASVKSIGSWAFSVTFPTDIYYGGSAADWNNILVYSFNEGLEDATIHYNWTVEAFVERMYTIALNRTSDATGLLNWSNSLRNGLHDGAGIASEFLNGAEFKMRGLSNSDYVDVLYRTFFNREADASGKALWVSILDAGHAREYVLSQFVNLDEFKILCETYGISRGVMFENGLSAHPGVSKFVNRLYVNVFGREADSAGLYAWALALSMRTETAKSAAMNFFGSQEYAMKNTSSATYVSDLYMVFMNRGADAQGLAAWAAAIDQGMSRTQVLESFAGSAEFAMIAASFGLQ